MAHDTTSETEATRALFSSVWGPMMLTPHDASTPRFFSTAGLPSMYPCMAGATATGIPLPRATVAIVVTGVSSMPLAILEIVLAVAGYTRKRSASEGSPRYLMCSRSSP